MLTVLAVGVAAKLIWYSLCIAPKRNGAEIAILSLDIGCAAALIVLVLQ